MYIQWQTPGQAKGSSDSVFFRILYCRHALKFLIFKTATAFDGYGTVLVMCVWSFMVAWKDNSSNL